MLKTLQRSTVATPAELAAGALPEVKPASALSQALALMAKDLRAELRSRDILVSVLVFALLVLVTFNFALNLQQPGEDAPKQASGVLWVAIILSSMLAFNHVFAREKEQETLDGLLLCPVERGAIFLGKFLGALLLTAVMELCLLPIFAVFTNLPVLSPSSLLAMLMGTTGFVAVGTLFAAVAMNTRRREVVLPILLLPVAAPIVIAATHATTNGLAGKPFADALSALGVLFAFDAVYLTLCPLLFEYVAEEGG